MSVSAWHKLRRLIARDQWSIGIYHGTSPFHLEPYIGNPVLTVEDITDVSAEFVADPFMVRNGLNWYMFFEILNAETGRGQIGVATSEDGFAWHYQGTVLAEPFHLSYPLVFEWASEHFMIPECGSTKSIRLYKSRSFPDEWEFIATLLEGRTFTDTTLFRFDDTWWILTDTDPHGTHELRVYFADNLLGPWTEHACSPVVAGNPHNARPAGRAVVLEDSVVRFAQSTYPVYGNQVNAFLISELTVDKYREELFLPDPLLKGSGIGWNAAGMHQVDIQRLAPDRWLACVDGLQTVVDYRLDLILLRIKRRLRRATTARG